MHIYRIGLSVVCAIAFLQSSSCSSLSKGECETMDWRTIGYEDGVSGYSGNRIAQHRKACAKYGVTADLSQYQNGRDQGLREYCRPANGFRVGARGNSYNGVCPAELDRDFVAAYQSGQELYTLRSRVNNANQQLRSMHQEYEHIDEDLIHVGAEILDPTISHEHRAELLLETKRLSERRGEIRRDIPQLERDLDAYERDLEAYRATLKYAE